MAGYFQMLNDKRRHQRQEGESKFLPTMRSAPQKAIEQNRKLVDDGLCPRRVGQLAQYPNIAVQNFNQNKFSSRLHLSRRPSLQTTRQNFPLDRPVLSPFEMEGGIFGKFILKKMAQRQDCRSLSDDDYGRLP